MSSNTQVKWKMTYNRSINLRWNHIRSIILLIVVIYIASTFLVLNGLNFLSILRSLLGFIIILIIPGSLLVHIFINDRFFKEPLVFLVFSFFSSIAINTIISVILVLFFSLNEINSLLSHIFVFIFLFSIDFLLEINKSSKNNEIISVLNTGRFKNRNTCLFFGIILGFLFVYGFGLFFPSLDQGYIEMSMYNESSTGLPPKNINENETILLNIRITNNDFYRINCSLMVKIGNVSYQNFNSMVINAFDSNNIPIIISDLEKGDHMIYFILLMKNEEATKLSFLLTVS